MLERTLLILSRSFIQKVGRYHVVTLHFELLKKILPQVFQQNFGGIFTTFRLLINLLGKKLQSNGFGATQKKVS